LREAFSDLRGTVICDSFPLKARSRASEPGTSRPARVSSGLPVRQSQLPEPLHFHPVRDFLKTGERRFWRKSNDVNYIQCSLAWWLTCTS